MKYEREIERKFTVEGLTYLQVYNCIHDKFDAHFFIGEVEDNAISFDLYWPGNKVNVDFIRLRENSRELTVKVTDKATIVDRIEENVIIAPGSMLAAERQQTLLFGAPLKITKRFSVFDCCITSYNGDQEIEELAIICLYTVADDPKKRVFLEVEAKDLALVDRVVTVLMKRLTLTPVPHSLYQIFKEGL